MIATCCYLHCKYTIYFWGGHDEMLKMLWPSQYNQLGEWDVGVAPLAWGAAVEPKTGAVSKK